MLSIEEGASVSVEGSVSVGKLLDESSGTACKLTVLGGTSLTARSMGKYLIVSVSHILVYQNVCSRYINEVLSSSVFV